MGKAVLGADEGRLVHVSGEAKAAAELADAELGVTAAALKLRRTVEMYQWVEETKSRTKKQSGRSEKTVKTYRYKKQWSERHQDSSRFKKPKGHRNS